MALTTTNLLQSAGWTSFGTAITSAIVEVDNDATLFIGPTIPGANVQGFTLPKNIPVSIPHIAALGGSIWIRANATNVTVKSDVA